MALPSEADGGNIVIDFCELDDIEFRQQLCGLDRLHLKLRNDTELICLFHEALPILAFQNMDKHWPQ